ncbi:cytochrome b/b6 domain-containing protein [Micavibrio aeruginosavorus]|uniref:cytochrome b/b6 domain-containing protein n=1 Tax=Micavibrio aeruginosavorus TaxID=349221 RepID=UPI003F4AACA0
MQWRNTSENYGVVAKSFHWVIALLVIGLLGVGLYLESLDPSPLMFKVSFWHKSFGITVLALVVLRVLWRFTNTHPHSLPSHARWEKTLAKITHGLLYLALFVMPLSGWIMSSAKRFSVNVFGWFTLPDLVGESEQIGSIARSLHGYAAYTLIALIGLHFAGAIKHHVIDKDSTLRRMLPMVAVVLGLMIAPASAADAPIWVLQKDQSTIVVEGTQMGAPFKGGFKTFDGTIHFDAANLAASKADMTIDLASFDSASKDRDGSVQGAEWFDSKTYPQAKFVTDKFEAGAEAGSYVAHGTLTIRDKAVPVQVPFTLVIDDAGLATADGSITINRLDYGVGAGQWSNPKDVGTDVKVTIHIVAQKQ